jgi:hypothetical protein
METAEKNYDIHDKEQLAVVEAFKHWRLYCYGARLPNLVFTDHQNLRYFMTSKVLNQHQVHWAEKLSEFFFRLFTVPVPRMENQMPSAGIRSMLCGGRGNLLQ